MVQISDPAPPAAAPDLLGERRRRRRLYSISTVLALTLALLVLVTVAVVVTPLLYLGRNSTVALLREKGDLVLNTIELRVRQQIEPPTNQLAFIAEVLSRSDGEMYDRKRIGDILTGALAATPQIASLGFVDAAYVSTTALRQDNGVKIETANLGRESTAAIPDAEPGGKWAGILHDVNGELYIVRRHAVYRDGTFLGTLFGHISVRQLSNFLTAMPGMEGNSFILYDHDYVLAHPRLTRPVPYLRGGQVLPRLDEVGDPVLPAIWDKPTRLPLLGRGSGSVHAVRRDGDDWLFIYRMFSDYSDKPWLIGTYFRAADALADVRQLMFAGAGAGIALIFATLAAILIGRWIARPVTELAEVARHLRGLRFSGTPKLPQSVFRELDDQVRAFAEMLAALRWFEAYVPRKLVRRLARRGDYGPLPSLERQVTVMFTDIAGFTPIAEHMSPAETARLLNQHFELITKCIEAEEGTLDKFIGDAVMAFWGAPSRQPDHAMRAVRAATRIATSIQQENRARARIGTPPIRIRIGIHTGRVIVGNIGAKGRINYTIVGDAVNAAERIEQLGRQFMESTGDDVVVLFSAATEKALGSSVARVAVGTFTLRGRAEAVPVFRLVSPAEVSPAAERAAAG